MPFLHDVPLLLANSSEEQKYRNQNSHGTDSQRDTKRDLLLPINLQFAEDNGWVDGKVEVDNGAAHGCINGDADIDPLVEAICFRGRESDVVDGLERDAPAHQYGETGDGVGEQ